MVNFWSTWFPDITGTDLERRQGGFTDSPGTKETSHGSHGRLPVDPPEVTPVRSEASLGMSWHSGRFTPCNQT